MHNPSQVKRKMPTMRPGRHVLACGRGLTKRAPTHVFKHRCLLGDATERSPLRVCLHTRSLHRSTHDTEQMMSQTSTKKKTCTSLFSGRRHDALPCPQYAPSVGSMLSDHVNFQSQQRTVHCSSPSPMSTFLFWPAK